MEDRTMTDQELSDRYEARVQENKTMTEREFTDRFVVEMLRLAGRPTFEEGESIEEYARETAPTYFEDMDYREDGPEECAASDVGYWE